MNRLGAETSPYLLQHANNPVHWWPWGEEALAEAKRSNRPILLSVGYAACHWCHVMAHESFESPEVAAVMNELFVCIKVDREERPDVDAIYMQALHLLGEHGGWPLTMFCTPAGEPFWGGTYFPYPARYGRPSFIDVLKGVSQAFHDKPQDVETNRAGLLKALNEKAVNKAIEIKGEGPLLAAQPARPDRDAARRGMRSRLGRLRPGAEISLALCLRADLARLAARPRQGAPVRRRDGHARPHVPGRHLRPSGRRLRALRHRQRMADPAFREDALRQCPADRSLDAGLAGDQKPALRPAHRRDLRLGAARDGGRGRRLRRDLRRRFGRRRGQVLRLGCRRNRRRAGPRRTAPSSARSTTSARRAIGNISNILHRNRAPALLGEAEEQRLAALRAKLKAVRDKRVWPGWDDKVLADWNGLMIAALANASAVFQRDDWLAAAVRAWRFVMDEMRDDHGRLFHSRRAGKSLHRATLDDYANMARAGVALFEATGETPYLGEVQALIAVLDRHFADKAGGGYFITADDAADLIVRNKHCHDNAVPSGNGTLVGVFARLWVLSGDATWHDKARRQVAAFAGELENNFFPLMTLLNGYETLQSATELVIVGDPATPDHRSAAPRGLCQEPAQQDRAPPHARHAAASPAIPPPARGWSAASRRSTFAAT